MPATMLSRVDFPQPEGPTMLTNRPSPTVRLTVSSTTNVSAPPGARNRLVSLSTAIAGAADPSAAALAPILRIKAASCGISDRRRLAPPGKAAPRPQAEHQQVDRHHHDHEADAPGQHHVDARVLEPGDELLA